MTKRSEKRDSKRKLILDAAADLFFRRGYIGTTMDAICERLEVTKPFVYYYFKDKTEILEALSFDAAEVTMNSLRIGARGQVGARDRLIAAFREFLYNHVRLFVGGSLFLRDAPYLSEHAQSRMRRLARRFRDDLVLLLEDAVAEKVIPEQNVSFTASAIGGIAGFMHTWYKPGGKLSPDEAAEELLRIMLRTVDYRGPIPQAVFHSEDATVEDKPVTSAASVKRRARAT